MTNEAIRVTPFREFIADWRRCNRMTAAQAADRFGISVGTWRGWEGGRACSADMIVRELLTRLDYERRAEAAEAAWREGL